MSKYASETSVPVERSKAEIEATLRRYGATGFYSGWQEDPPASAIGFTIEGRMMRIDMPMPSLAEFERTKQNKKRTKPQQEKAWEQAQRQRWRALLLIVKAKLEFIDCGLSTVEKEFLSDILLPNGVRVGEVMKPQIESAYETGEMPPLLPAYGGES